MGGRLRQLALQASRQVEELVADLAAGTSAFRSGQAIAALVDGFSRHLQQPVQIQIEVGAPTHATPIQIEQQRYA